MTDKEQKMEALKLRASRCCNCPHLVKSRKNLVFGEGSLNAEVMFVGEAPGEKEDETGSPFVGRAGRLLTACINRMGFTRKEVYIANVLMCRPDTPGGSGNRKPVNSEARACLPYLKEKIGIIQPKVLILLGATAAEAVLDKGNKLGQLRGLACEYAGIPVIVTFHPAYILRNLGTFEGAKFWNDLLETLRIIGFEISPEDVKWSPG